MSVQFDPSASVNWSALLNKLSETDGANAVQFSEADRTLTFTNTVDGTSTQITVRIPDDLDLPGEVDETSFTTLIEKLSDESLGLTDEQIEAFKEQITKLYEDMSAALSNVQSTSTGKVMFDLYKLMALLVEVAQSQRDAARDLRTTQSQQIQNSIQSQADTQRAAAMVGLIVGVVCGAISAIVSIGMLAGQAASFKNQLNTARTSGADAAQSNAQMTKAADNAAHANAQLEKVESQVGEPIATDVKADMDGKLNAPDGPKAKVQKAEIELAEKQTALENATVELNAMKLGARQDPQAVQAAQTEVDQARAAAEIPEGKTAAKAKMEYIRDCAQRGVPTDDQKIAKYNTAIQAESKLKTAQQAPTQEQISAKELEVNNLRAARNDARTELATARDNYRASIKSAADAYTDKYNAAVAADGPNSDAAKTARNEMRMAQAYAGSKLNEPGVSTAVEHRADVAAAESAVDSASQRLNNNTDYRKALHRIDRYAGINAINTAVANMLQGVAQNISAMINSEATREGAVQEQEKEELEQTKDLFDNAKNLIDSVIQLMQAVSSAESQSMRDAIQA